MSSRLNLPFAALSILIAAPAAAQDESGSIQIKGFVTTVTAKYHFDLGGGIKPYLGAGPTYFMIFGEDVGPDAAALGATDVDLSDELGFVLQAGVDIPINDRGLGLSLDAKRYFVGTTATFNAGDSVALRSHHDLDPWVLSTGLAYRF